MADRDDKRTKVRDGKLDSATARLKLPARREPHWRSIQKGFALGYRRIQGKGGTWIARSYKADSRKLRYHALGAADDFASADGRSVLTFAQAQDRARGWLKQIAVDDAGGVDLSKPPTVGDALAAYIADYRRGDGRAEKPRTVAITERIVEAVIRPAVGSIRLDLLKKAQLKQFYFQLAETGRRLRTKKGVPVRVQAFDPTDAEQVRRRRASANRVFNILRAALHHAHSNGLVATDAAWAGIASFKKVDAARVRYLQDDEATRLVNACGGGMRELATAALLTGCRYGELARLRAKDFHADSGTLRISMSKSGNPRDVVLTDEGQQFFVNACAGKEGEAFLFLRANGQPWRPVDQVRPLRVACKAAKVAPAIGFHVLRHSYASRLARQGVPMAVIAAQLGHADLRMTEKHYAHLAPGYVAETVRKAFGPMGLIPLKSNVKNLAAARARRGSGSIRAFQPGSKK